MSLPENELHHNGLRVIRSEREQAFIEARNMVLAEAKLVKAQLHTTDQDVTRAVGQIMERVSERFSELDIEELQKIRNTVVFTMSNLPKEAIREELGLDNNMSLTPRQFKRKTFADILALPTKGYAVEQLIRERATYVLYGPSEAGKSLFNNNLVMSFLTETPFLGKYEVKGGPVAYLSGGEGLDAWGDRVRAWLEHYGSPEVKHPFVAYEDAINLSDTKEVMALLMDMVEALGEPPALVIVDTIARHMGGKDDKEGKDAVVFMNNMDLIRNATGAVVIATGHTPKNDPTTIMGSAYYRNNADGTIRLYRREDDIVEMHNEKDKYGPKFEPRELTMLQVGEGVVFHELGVLEERKRREISDAERKVLILLYNTPEGCTPKEIHTVRKVVSQSTWKQGLAKKLLERGWIEDVGAFRYVITDEGRKAIESDARAIHMLRR